MERADADGERRTWFRLLVGAHLAVLLVLMIDAWERNHIGFPGMVGIGIFLVAVQGTVVLGVLLSGAAFGFVLPIVVADIAAALFLPRGAGVLAPLIGAGFGAAAGIGITLQLIVIRDWRRRTAAGWGRTFMTGVGIAAAVGAIVVGGAALVTWWAFSPKVQPAYLEDLRTDPMASFGTLELILEYRRETDAAETWKGFREAQIEQRYAIGPASGPEEALGDAVAAAQASGWELVTPVDDDSARLTKDGRSLAIFLLSTDEPQLLVRLRGP